MLTGQKFGKYEINSKIGEGGMGEVYSAQDPELGRNVAIKILPAEFSNDEERKSRFRLEARAASALNHPNIVTIYEIGENEHGSFLATELIEGRTLRQIIAKESITLPRILRIAEQTANALVAAHAAGIVHRDIKPENIMVRRDSIVKVVDFGLAKPNEQILISSGGESNRTVPGTVMGSARYMSPEQARGQEIDGRTDIWSLGVVLYEMLAGSVPFDGETTADTLAAVIYKEPPAIWHHLPNAPLELQRIIRKALQKDREERYQSVKDFALDLKDLLYELEHANSGDRAAHTTSSPDFSENPTILHKTISGNHPTGRTLVMTSGMNAALAAPQKRRRLSIGLLAAAAIVFISALSLGAYRWMDSPVSLANGSFEKPQISRVSTDGKVLLPAISPDGKYLAYVNGEVGNQSLVVRQISTDSIVTVVPATNLNFASVTFSPTGDRVYYTQTRSDFSVNTLYQVPTLGGPSKKLIEDVDSPVTFSPDGKRFAFMRHTTKNNEDVIFTVDAATLETTELINSGGTGFDFFSARPAWSPDGTKILTGAGKREGGFVSSMAVGTIDVAEKTFKAIDTGKFFTVGNFAWFADGSGFLCAGRETQTGPVQVWRTAYPAIDFHQVTNDFNDYAEIGLSTDGKTIVTMKGETTSSLWKFSPASKDAAQITPDGRTVFGFDGLAQSTQGPLVFTSKEGKTFKLWKADGDGKNAKALLDEPGSSMAPSISPDGKTIVFSRQIEKTSRIWRMNADGSSAVQLTEEDPNFVDFNPQITPDGKLIIFQRQTANTDRVTFMKMPVEGGTPMVFYSNEGWSLFQPRISPDGKRIAFGTFDIKTFEKKLRVATLDGYNFGKIESEMEYNLVNQFMWSPDGKYMTILTTRNGTPNVWRQPIDGAAPTPITAFTSGRIFNFAWAADGKNLILARGNTVNDLLLIRDASRSAEAINVAGPQRRSQSVFDRFTSIFADVR